MGDETYSIMLLKIFNQTEIINDYYISIKS